MAEECNLILYLHEADGTPIGMQYRNTSYAEGVFDTYWFEKNLQGDIVAVYNQAGTKLIAYTYDAWGKVTSSGSIAQINPIRYRGYYYDTDTGFYYLQSRYYDPAIKRFVSADNIGYLGESATFFSYNLYAYCENNPIKYRDNSGTSITIAIGATAAIVGLSIYGIMT